MLNERFNTDAEKLYVKSKAMNDKKNSRVSGHILNWKQINGGALAYRVYQTLVNNEAVGVNQATILVLIHQIITYMRFSIWESGLFSQRF